MPALGEWCLDSDWNPDATPILLGRSLLGLLPRSLRLPGEPLDVRTPRCGRSHFGPMTEGLGVCLASRKSSATTL